MSSGNLLFYVCTVVCVAGALVTVLAHNPVRGAVGLLATVIGIAGLFLKLNAEFLAAIQLIVYAGAVVVLFVFVIMLLGPDAGAQAGSTRARLAKGLGALLLLVMAIGVLVLVAPDAEHVTWLGPVPPDHGSVEAVGGLLFSEGIVPFEAATALLIVAVVGAIAVARGKQGIRKMRGSVTPPRELFGGPVHPRDAGHPLSREAGR